MKLKLVFELREDPTNDVLREELWEVEGEEFIGDPVPVGVEGDVPGGRWVMSGRSVCVINVGNDGDGAAVAPVGGAGRMGVFFD